MMLRSPVAASQVSPDEHNAQGSSVKGRSNAQLAGTKETIERESYPEIQFISIRLLILFMVLEIGFSELPDRLPPRRRPLPNVCTSLISQVLGVMIRFIVILVDPRFPTSSGRGKGWRCRVVVTIHLPALVLCLWWLSGLGLLDSR